MRLDEELLAHIADSMPDLSVVLVGPKDGVFEKSSLLDKKNVFFLGTKKPAQTPAYVQHFTLCINPQIINSLTIGNYPRKIDEYLASGKPVVATATKAMDMFREHVSLCVTKEEFVIQIRKILADPDSTSIHLSNVRREFALKHTWENSVGEMGDAFYALKKYHQKVEI
jgi:glycosyltransferase involved in cell wall biosynthesis